MAKIELADQFISGLFLRRIGAVFVERFDKQRGVADTRIIMLTVQAGQSLMFFPEGTFTRMPGLLPFRMGAFVVAVDLDVPVVPVTIRGTRSLLRSDTWFPRHTAVRVSVGAPILADGEGWEAAVKQRDLARAALLAHLGEPDLA